MISPGRQRGSGAAERHQAGEQRKSSPVFATPATHDAFDKPDGRPNLPMAEHVSAAYAEGAVRRRAPTPGSTSSGISI